MQSFIDSICWRKLVLGFNQRRLIIPIPIFCLPWNPRPLLPILYFVHHISSYCGCFHVKHSYLYFLGIILQTLLIIIMHLSENKSIFTVCKWQILTTIVLAGRVILYLLCYLMVDVQYICVLRFLLPAMRILPAGSKRTFISEILLQTGVIIWDGAPMQHKFEPEALDWILQELFKNDFPFGRITVLFGGDFYHTLPIIPKDTKQEIMGAAYCQSYLWRNTHVYHLTKNCHLINSSKSCFCMVFLGCWLWKMDRGWWINHYSFWHVLWWDCWGPHF